MEKTLEIRTRQYDHPVNALVTEKIADGAITSDTLREPICTVIREELLKLLPTALQPQAASLSDVIWKVQQALGFLRRRRQSASHKLWFTLPPFIAQVLLSFVAWRPRHTVVHCGATSNRQEDRRVVNPRPLSTTV